MCTANNSKEGGCLRMPLLLLTAHFSLTLSTAPLVLHSLCTHHPHPLPQTNLLALIPTSGFWLPAPTWKHYRSMIKQGPARLRSRVQSGGKLGKWILPEANKQILDLIHNIKRGDKGRNSKGSASKLLVTTVQEHGREACEHQTLPLTAHCWGAAHHSGVKDADKKHHWAAGIWRVS